MWTAPTHTDATRDRSKEENTVSGDGGKGDSGEQEKWKNPFADVSENDSFYPAVEYVYKNELFRGVSANRFAPHSTMTRAMFVTVLGRLAGVDQSEYTKTSFSDAVAGEWYSAYKGQYVRYCPFFDNGRRSSTISRSSNVPHHFPDR